MKRSDTANLSLLFGQSPGSRALPKYISPQMASSSKRSARTPPSNFSTVTLPVKR
jgi:hypothetical protein